MVKSRPSSWWVLILMRGTAFHLGLQPAGVTFREAKAVVIPLHLQLVSAVCEEYACLLEHLTGCFDVSLVARHGN
jgi:hypothetical protein